MDHEVHVIKQHPFGLVVTFNAVGARVSLFEQPLYFVRNGLDLARIGACADNKVIGKCSGVPVHLQDGQVFAFFVLNSFDRQDYLPSGLDAHPCVLLLWVAPRKDSTLCPVAPSFSACVGFAIYRCSFLMYPATISGTKRLSTFAGFRAAARICVEETRSFTPPSR